MNAPALLTWLAGTVLPLGALWLLFRLALRAERCFGYNRVLLLLAPVVAALLPRLVLPEWTRLPGGSSAGAAGWSVLLPPLQPEPGGAGGGGAGWPWLTGLYLAGVALGLARLAYQGWQLRRRTRRLPREVRPGYAVARTGGQLPTSSFGNTIFWDETLALTPAQAAAVLAHELAHVRQGHSRDVLWLELWRAVLWPNPFAHLLLPAARLTHELLADREATGAAAPPEPGGPVAAYAALLAQSATRRLVAPAHPGLLQPFTFSFTLTRIAMLQNQNPVRRWKQWLALPVLAGLLVVAGRPARAQVAPSNSAETPPPPPRLSQGKPSKDITTANPGGKPAKAYNYVEQMPELPNGGGSAAIVAAIQDNLVYPATASGAESADGKVFVSFVVGADGLVGRITIIKGLKPAYDTAVVRAVEQLPRLTPGRQHGQAVPVSLTVPVSFVRSAPK